MAMAPGRRTRGSGFARLLIAAGLFLLLPFFMFITIELAGELKASQLPHLHDIYHGVTEGTAENGQIEIAKQERQLRRSGVTYDKTRESAGKRVETGGQKPSDILAVDVLQEPRCSFAVGVDRVENITTQRLYDEIGFKNEEGGVWRQGWPITYDGAEWDERKLRVFLVPHSHNDPGWIRTLEEYYKEKTFNILNVIVQALKADSRRKFIWEEMSYLSMWWSDERVSQGQKDDFKWLVEQGQLEIVGGGWVMNDEANAHHFAIVDQVNMELIFGVKND